MSNLNELLIVTDEDVARARKHYQKSESDIKQDVAILKEWLRQQPHLPDNEDEGRLERIFFKNKCRMEQTKKKLDKCYSFKVFYPDVLEFYNINSDTIRNAIKSIILIPLPKLTDKQERVMFMKITNPDIYNGHDGFMYLLMLMEICITYDYSLADIVFMDCCSLSLTAIKTLQPSTLHKFSIIGMDGLSGRFSSIQYLNPPTFMDIFLRMAKMFLKPKLFSKIKCSANIEDIHAVIPKRVLPIEYGGEEKSIYDLHEAWCKELQHHADLLTKISKRVSNEKLRTEKLDDSDLFGTDGTFKKINLD